MVEIKANFNSARFLMCNTDSLAFVCNKDESLGKFDISGELGKWKHQLKDSRSIIDFFALSPVAYHFTYENHEMEIKQITKISGFSLQNQLAYPAADALDFGNFVSKAAENKDEDYAFEQLRKSVDKSGSIKLSLTKYYLRNTVSKKRILCKDFTTKPFGYMK